MKHTLQNQTNNEVSMLQFLQHTESSHMFIYSLELPLTTSLDKFIIKHKFLY